MNSVLLNTSIAWMSEASSSSSTKPKPRERFITMSITILKFQYSAANTDNRCKQTYSATYLTLFTDPTFENRSMTSASVAAGDRPPTKSLGPLDELERCVREDCVPLELCLRTSWQLREIWPSPPQLKQAPRAPKSIMSRTTKQRKCERTHLQCVPSSAAGNRARDGLRHRS